MKRIIALALCLMFLFGACSGKKTIFNESDAFSYVGAGEITIINTLVNSNGFFVSNVFVADHLPVDAAKTTEVDSNTYALVVSEQFKTYDDFERKLRSTYTTAACDELLASDKYINIDGKLWFNMKYETAEKYSIDWSEADAEASINENGIYEITAKVKNSIGLPKSIELTAINENGNIRLESICY